MVIVLVFIFFFFKQKTAYELRISDWSSDVCSSDLIMSNAFGGTDGTSSIDVRLPNCAYDPGAGCPSERMRSAIRSTDVQSSVYCVMNIAWSVLNMGPVTFQWKRSEEHTSELQSLMRISYAVFCLKKKNKTNNIK